MTTTPIGAAFFSTRELLADWLGCLAMLDPSERSSDICGWCGGNHALAIARTISVA
ncbi:hypothetical protein ACFY2M_19055 [Streptomyces sp. NPDC001276]|uniref:hypothetical protein n=1 Tax=Streptomyces sp. NPDC001276 TaxID=3364555 RepID=UPI0036D0DF14